MLTYTCLFCDTYILRTLADKMIGLPKKIVMKLVKLEIRIAEVYKVLQKQQWLVNIL